MSEKNILAILGSPHSNGMTAAMLDCAILKAEKVGYIVTKINLYEKNLSYIGEYDVNFIYAKVEVRVQNGEITDIIILEHRHEHGKAAETVINEIVDEQRIDVDAVSGATNSSIVIKKAVENALKSGL